MLTRRQMLQRSAQTAASLAFFSQLTPLFAEPVKRRFKIGACDWSIGAMATPKSFEIAKKIGLDGVQISLGTARDDMKLRKPEVQQEFKDAAKAAGVEFGGLAIGEMNNIPYKSDPRTEAWVSDSVDVMQALGIKVVLLAFFGNGDLVNDAAGTDEVIRRLKKVAPKAEKAGVVLGLESWLSAEDTMRIMDKVGSPAVKMYYDVCNSTVRGYDIFKEIRWLGKKNICEFHMKENGYLLGQGKIDLVKVRAAIEDIGYEGWMQIEGAVPSKADLVTSYVANLKCLRELFPA
ncbi:MAG: sugar phosphate isomerase/epimerase [Verrucomicrobia bacterium]|nr:sugar phosphate isomerase/epimerase [Verrucomicrobiota bacterium]